MNSVHFCLSEYLRHLNPEHHKISLATDLVTDVFVFGAMEQPQCEEYNAGAHCFGGLFSSPRKCEGGTLPSSRIFQGHFFCGLAGNMKGLISPLYF